MSTELVEIIKVNELEPTQSEIILKSFTEFFDKAKTYEAKAKAIVITDPGQVTEMQEARRIRIEVKNIRTKADEVRRKLKERSMREGNAIQGIYNVIKAVTVPIEEHLEQQEKFVERIEAEKRLQLGIERTALLSPFLEDTSFYNLAEMSQQGFDQLLTVSKNAYEARVAAEKKAEDDRIAKEKSDKAEQDRIIKENEKLKAEAEAKAKKDAVEKQKIDEENARIAKEREAENKERERLEAEIKAKNEAEAKAKADAEAKDKAENEAAARLAKEKAYCDFLEKNGVNPETKPLYHIEKIGNEVKLYKLVDTFTIEG